MRIDKWLNISEQLFYPEYEGFYCVLATALLIIWQSQELAVLNLVRIISDRLIEEPYPVSVIVKDSNNVICNTSMLPIFIVYYVTLKTDHSKYLRCIDLRQNLYLKFFLIHLYFSQTSASAPMLPPRDLSPPPLPPRPSGRRSSTVEPSGSPSRHMFFNGPQPHHSTGIQT